MKVRLYAGDMNFKKKIGKKVRRKLFSFENKTVKTLV